MVDYILHAVPTAVLVLIHFIRTEHRLTRIETLIEILMTRSGCNSQNDLSPPKTTPLNGLKRGDLMASHIIHRPKK